VGRATACLETGRCRVYLPDMSNDPKAIDIDAVIWRQPDGELVSCEEKLVVLRENLEEIRQECQDALEDAVLMGCDEAQVRDVLEDLVRSIVNPYPPK